MALKFRTNKCRLFIYFARMPPLSVAVSVLFLEFRDASGWVVLCGTVALVLFILCIEEMWVCGPVFGNKVLKYQIEKKNCCQFQNNRSKHLLELLTCP